MNFRTIDDVKGQIVRPPAEAIEWDRAQQLGAFQELRRLLGGRGEGGRIQFHPARSPTGTWRQAA